jgi:ADP-ribose pyrophosphatase YjhB (NUDIX family)
MKQVCCCILIKNNKFLLQLRDNTRKIKDRNKWSLFGGLLNSQENLKDCISRELREETGLRLNNIKKIFFVKKKEFKCAIHVFKCKNLNKKIKLQEGQGYKFLKKKELKKKIIFKNKYYYMTAATDYIFKKYFSHKKFYKS